MRAELLLVGTELLLGQIVDTNGPYLARLLAEAGIDLFRKVIVGDNLKRVASALNEAAERADLLILTGGLGPTVDDLTAEAIATAFDVPLVENQAAKDMVAKWALSHGRSMDERQAKQARMPLGGVPLANPVGSAPGIYFTQRGKTVIALPGVPAEMAAIAQESLRSILSQLGGGEVLRSVVLHVGGLGEAEVDRRLGTLWHNPNPTVGVTVGNGVVDVRVTAKGTPDHCARLLADFVPRIRAALGDEAFGEDDLTLEAAVARLLLERGLRIAVAESCTGGLLADRLTDVPGASSFIERGVVTYSNLAKVELLSVPPEVLASHGAVSEPVSRLMAEGVKRLACTDIGIGVTGIAGPGGGTAAKPVGLVHLALAAPEGTWHRELRLGQNRRGNKLRAASAALLLLLDYLRGRLV